MYNLFGAEADPSKQISKTKIIYISYSTLKSKLSFHVDSFISARSKTLANLRKEIVSHLPAPAPAPAPPSANAPSTVSESVPKVP
jgi:elongator complex protein 5